jgi:hypothetical protein
LLRGEHLMGPFRDGESTIGLSPGSAWIRFIGGERHVGTTRPISEHSD